MRTLNTVTVNEQLAVRPLVSVGVHVTVVVPGGKQAPDGGTCRGDARAVVASCGRAISHWCALCPRSWRRRADTRRTSNGRWLRVIHSHRERAHAPASR